MLIYIDFSVLSAIRNYDLEGKDSHCVEICTQPDLKGLNETINEIYHSNIMKCFPGPTSDNPSVPFVLVGAAHCNFVCKDGDTGNTLETCCCRPDSVLSSCLNKSPYCVGKPEFKSAEPKVSSLLIFPQCQKYKCLFFPKKPG